LGYIMGVEGMDEAIRNFLNFLTVERGASENTLAAYRNDLQQFSHFIAGRKKSLSKITRNDVVNYMLSLKEKAYAETTVARKLAAVKSFFAFLSGEGLVQRDPTENLPAPRIGKTLPKYLTPEQVDELLEQPNRRTGPEAKRDRAMLEVLYATGMRVTELVSINVEDISLSPETAHVRCMGKGSKERMIPIHVQAAQILETYMKESRPLFVRNKPETALFVNRRGERLTRQGFWLILKTYARDADLGDEVTPHTLRHSFATHMLRGGTPLRNVQELLGHANISTTQIYTYLTRDHVREVYEEAHPRAS
jgi:integrase/recombinase XerD